MAEKNIPSIISQDVVNKAALEIWQKLYNACNQTLDSVLSGETEITASTIAAVTKFLESSTSFANSAPVVQQPFTGQYHESLYGPLPVFDDDDEDETWPERPAVEPAPQKRGRGRPKANT